MKLPAPPGLVSKGPTRYQLFRKVREASNGRTAELFTTRSVYDVLYYALLVGVYLLANQLPPTSTIFAEGTGT